MLRAPAVLCVCAAAWCAQALAAAVGRPASGNFLDDKQWLSTVSQYDREAGQWNRFRDDDYFRTWSPGKTFEPALDPAEDPCLKVKCSHHEVCTVRGPHAAVCVGQRRLPHRTKDAAVRHKWCKQCPGVSTSPVCGSDGRTYSSQCKLEYQACVLGKQISVRCEGHCPCPSGTTTSTSRNAKRACSALELREVASRLRDWFKALHESGGQNTDSRASLRLERSRFDTSILPICKDSLGWMFNRLDTNYDLLLDPSELGSMYLDKNEPCAEAFFNSCDTYRDRCISNNEWCACFQRQQAPPCQTERSSHRKRLEVKKFLGQYIPQCDEDGYYKPRQCRSGAGPCWCVDRYGNEVAGADCAVDFETSGDFASGDFREWAGDMGEDGVTRGEDEIGDDEEEEGDDDDGGDQDGYV
ncbi:testican-3 isoform X1 [Camelus dromedarius]|uniref:testican-3 isoform X1 n=1 Tax=Camelus dromedarius TaxID=9838 RepID=UPI00311A384C